MSPNNRLGKCEVCNAKCAIYTCPNCEVKTCSLRCTQIHKKELNCDGVRARTTFKTLRQMSKNDVKSDLKFLDDCQHFVEARKRSYAATTTHFITAKKSKTDLNTLRFVAQARNITLNFLSSTLSAHQKNTTFFNKQQDIIYWRLEWLFVNAISDTDITRIDERCNENRSLYEVLKNQLYPTNDDKNSNVSEKDPLIYYKSVALHGLKLLLKAQDVKGKGDVEQRFYLLDIDKNLKENLSGKTIVEFPQIYVTYEKHPIGFDIIDSDEEENETKVEDETEDEAEVETVGDTTNDLTDLSKILNFR